MSILDSDDDADMEQSLTEQRNLQQSLEERHTLEEHQQSLEERQEDLSLTDDQPMGRIVDVPLTAIQSLGNFLGFRTILRKLVFKKCFTFNAIISFLTKLNIFFIDLLSRTWRL